MQSSQKRQFHIQISNKSHISKRNKHRTGIKKDCTFIEDWKGSKYYRQDFPLDNIPDKCCDELIIDGKYEIRFLEIDELLLDNLLRKCSNIYIEYIEEVKNRRQVTF